LAIPMENSNYLDIKLFHLPNLQSGAIRFRRSSRGRTNGHVTEHRDVDWVCWNRLDEYKSVTLWSNDCPSGVREARPSIFSNTVAIHITHCSGSRKLLFVPRDRRRRISQILTSDLSPPH